MPRFQGQVFSPAGGGRLFSNRQEITATGPFVVPNGVRTVWVTATGSGGGGGGSGNGATLQTLGGGGGSGETVFRKPVTVTPGQSITVTIGAGGTAGSGSASSSVGGNPGGNGGSVTFGSLVTATGGGGGGGGAATDGNSPLPGAKGTSSGALAFAQLIQNAAAIQVYLEWGVTFEGQAGASGQGAGASFWSTTSSTAVVGQLGYGAGSQGGGGGGFGVPNAGTVGKTGVCIVEW